MMISILSFKNSILDNCIFLLCSQSTITSTTLFKIRLEFTLKELFIKKYPHPIRASKLIKYFILFLLYVMILLDFSKGSF